MKIIKHLVVLEVRIAKQSAGVAGKNLSLDKWLPSLQGGGGRAFSSIAVLPAPELC